MCKVQIFHCVVQHIAYEPIGVNAFMHNNTIHHENKYNIVINNKLITCLFTKGMILQAVYENLDITIHVVSRFDIQYIKYKRWFYSLKAYRSMG